MKPRIEFLDFAKGTGIFLVIWGHAMEPGSPFLYSFHMPLFLFLSGYVFKEKKIKDIVTAKFGRLIIPYIFFFVISWLFYSIVPIVKGDWQDKKEHALLLLNILIGDKNNGGNVPIWFLVALFVLNILYGIICLATKNVNIRSGIILILSVIGNYMYWHDIHLPYQIDPVLSSIPFFHFGYEASKINPEKIKEKFHPLLIMVILIALFIIQLITYRLNIEVSGITKVNIFENIVGNYFYFYIPAFCATLYYLAMCYKLNYNKIVKFYGVNSLVILGTHDIIVKLLARSLRKYIDTSAWWVELSIAIVVLLICTPLIFLARKHVPQLTGYKSFFSKSHV